MRRFNVTGHCVGTDDYMVDTSNKIEKVVQMIDRREYFTINRARQYGKTTTLALLKCRLSEQYIVASISFEGVGEGLFESEERFCSAFKDLVGRAFKFSALDKNELDKWNAMPTFQFKELSESITQFCENKKIVLLIDEVDKASDNRVFLHFLGMLRNKFLYRKSGEDFTFHSVILAGVHDVKNIKLKLIREGKYTQSGGEGSYNSPWNIAANFDVDMSFNPSEIATMLNEYETDYKTCMDIQLISQEIFNYTSGYPFLVSAICKGIDEVLNKDWTINGVQEAVKIILAERSTLFDDIIKNLENNTELYRFIYDLLVVGSSKSFQIDNPLIDLGVTFGVFKNQEGKVSISNRIFETRIYNYFISKEENGVDYKRITGVLQHDIVQDERFDMELCLVKFSQHYKEIFDYENKEDASFLERHGRMDIVVDYGRDQFIIELKIWRGDSEHQNAYSQLLGYMDSKNAKTGYLLSFDFRKGANKQTKAEWIEMDGKKIFDVIL